MKTGKDLNTLANKAAAAVDKLREAVTSLDDEQVTEAYYKHMRIREAGDFLDDWQKVVNAVFHEHEDAGELLDNQQMLEDLPYVTLDHIDDEGESWTAIVRWKGETRHVAVDTMQLWWTNSLHAIDEEYFPWPKGVSNVRAAVLWFCLNHWVEADVA